MTLAELYTVLSGTGLPVAYLAFSADNPPELPFIVYQETGSHNLGADNKVWHSATRIQIDLLSRTKSRATEQLLEDALNDAGIFWERESSYDSDEIVYRITYTVEI